MQKRFTWIGLTALCLAAYVPWCNPAPRNASGDESFASQLEQRLPKHDFGYGSPAREEGALPPVEQRITKLVFAHLEEGEFNSLVMMSYYEPDRHVTGKSEARVYVYDRTRRLFGLQQGTAVAGKGLAF